MESENFKLNMLKLKKENPFVDKLENLKLSKGVIGNLNEKILLRNDLAEGDLDKRIKKANKI